MFNATCFCYLSFIMSQLLLSRVELTKCIPSILMESCEYAICPGSSILFYMDQLIRPKFLKSLSLSLEVLSCDFKIDCILVWHLISLNRKLVVLLGSFNVFISRSPCCTPLILVLASIKIASTL